MDAYLSREAYHFLLGLNLASSKPTLDGILIGHKRGHRFFVEKVFPAQGFYSSLENYFALDEHFRGKLIGFFSYEADEKKKRKILLPFAYGQLFLDIRLTPKKKMDIKSYVIDHKKDFFLSPIDLKISKSGG
ncbi:MAG: hypothetical protein GTO17_13175 [Candidatus Aminicenantes bacterium]|nr:hypothetical protein [Candidatus Aminicenantes bacterium]